MCRRVIKQKKKKGGWEERESGKRAGDKSYVVFEVSTREDLEIHSVLLIL